MNGGVIGAVNLPTLASATGVWSLEEVKLAQQQSIWPLYYIPDPYWEYVSLLLSGDTATTNGAQNNTFLDSSTNNFTLSRNGNTTQGSFSPYGSNWSGYFDGNGDYLSIPYNSAFNLTGDFTVEFWMNPTNLPSTTGTAPQSYARIFSFGTYNAANSLGLEINSNDGGNLRRLVSWYNGTGSNLTNNNAIDVGTWYHVAVVRSGTTITCYLNGTSTGTITGASAAVNTSQSFYIASLQGFESDTSACFAGYISNFRLVKGEAVYTTSFTPSTTPLTAIAGTSLLTCQNNRFIDNSLNNFTVTNNGNGCITKFSPFNLTYQTSFSYGAYFDGNGDYLTLNSSAALGLGSSDFTLELWAYFDNASAINDQPFYTNITASGYLSNTFWFGKAANSSGKVAFFVYNYSSSTYFIIEPTLPPANQWVHYALVRNGNTFTIYRNGTSTVSSTFSGAVTGSTSPGIIARALDGAATDMFSGYMSNLRLVKGTAVYTSNFTPPTTQLTAITNTSLLVCQSSTFIDNSTNNFTITVYGNSKPTTFSPFTNSYTSLPYSAAILGGSGYFDGTGDYVNIASQTQLNLGTSNFTIELWFYDDGSSLTCPTMLANGTGWTSGSFGLRYNGIGHANKVGVYLNPSDPLISSTNTFASRCWHHVALTRSGNTYTLYVDGTNQGSATQAGDFNLGFGGTNIGLSAWDGAQGYYKGYVTDVRVVSGTVLYNGTFVPPNSPLTAISNTQLLCNFTNGGIIDSSTINDSETLGNAQVSTSIKKYGFGSIYLDGSGDVVLIEPTQDLEFGSGDFTIEFWLYRVGTGRMAIYAGSFGADWSIGIDISSVAPNTSNTIGIWASSTGSSWNLVNADTGGNGIGTIAVAQFVWTHVAYVRNGSTWMSFVNGVRDRNITGVSGSIVNRATYQKAVGSWFSTGAEAPLNGYLSDFRITKGLARYTANFTPPVNSLPRF